MKKYTLKELESYRDCMKVLSIIYVFFSPYIFYRWVRKKLNGVENETQEVD